MTPRTRRGCRRSGRAGVEAAGRPRAVAAAGRRGPLQRPADRGRRRRHARARARRRRAGARRLRAAPSRRSTSTQAKARAYAPDKRQPRADRPRSAATSTPAWRRRRRSVDAVYTTPIEHHNPMEPHATIAALGRRPADALRRDAGRRRRAHDGREDRSASPPENVRVIGPFVGGGFGCKGSAWSHVVLAAMARARRSAGR